MRYPSAHQRGRRDHHGRTDCSVRRMDPRADRRPAHDGGPPRSHMSFHLTWTRFINADTRSSANGRMQVTHLLPGRIVEVDRHQRQPVVVRVPTDADFAVGHEEVRGRGPSPRCARGGRRRRATVRRIRDCCAPAPRATAPDSARPAPPAPPPACRSTAWIRDGSGPVPLPQAGEPVEQSLRQHEGDGDHACVCASASTGCAG
jgi:hypothetical protein